MENYLGKYLVQNQKMTITPNMVEYIKLLQIPGMDMENYIEEELIENPLLEKEVREEEVNKILDYDEKNYYDRSSSTNLKESGADRALTLIRKRTTLKEYLHQQLLEIKTQPELRKIVGFLIECLDRDGYLTESNTELSSLLNTDKEVIRAALRVLHGMDPAGVGARNLKECILIQLLKKKLLNSENKNLIIFHFEALVKKNYQAISKKTGLPINKICEFHEVIKNLNPKPGSAFSEIGYQTVIVPDLLIIETDGEFSVVYNEESTPSIRINGFYRKMLRDPNANEETKEYIKRGIVRANNFLRAIEQRKQTILETAKHVVEFQKDFIREGNSRLKPLTMKQVGEAVGISESTVSRVVNDKYLQTPRGVLELRDFFSSKLSLANDIDMSAAGAKDMIRKMISEESKCKPMSDEKIKKMLEEENIVIARRTVAKYREELGILPAYLRKS